MYKNIENSKSHKFTKYKNWAHQIHKKTQKSVGLWNTCNKLRGSVSAIDYVNVVLGLLFL